jgi:hypothetical protein
MASLLKSTIKAICVKHGLGSRHQSLLLSLHLTVLRVRVQSKKVVRHVVLFKHNHEVSPHKDIVVVESQVLNLMTKSPDNSQKPAKRLRSLVLGSRHVMHDEARLEVRNEAIIPGHAST